MPATDAWEVESWLEWEERTLQRAIHGRDSAALEAALAKISSAVVGRTHLVGDTLTLADIAIFGGLLPLMRHAKVRIMQSCTSSTLMYSNILTSHPAASVGLCSRLMAICSDT